MSGLKIRPLKTKILAVISFLICSILSLVIVSISKATSPTTYYVSTTGVDGNNITGLSNPMGMAIVNSEVWVVNRGNNTINVFNENGRSIETTIDPISGNSLNNPGGIALIGSNKVWVANIIASGTISVFNTDGTAGANISGNGLNSPWGIAQIASNSANYVWVTNSGNNTISVFNTDGTTLTGTSTYAGNGLNTPLGIAVVGSQIWVANNGNKTVSRFNPDGTSAGSVLSGNGLNNNPFGIAVVGSQVWVADSDHAISRFNTDGTSAGAVLSGNGISNASGIVPFTYNSRNLVWVANGVLSGGGGNNISIFNQDGTDATGTCTSSLPCGSLSYATGLAQPGDTVLVQAGTYNNTQVIKSAGSSGSPVTVKANGTVTLSRASPANDTAQQTAMISINASASYTTVDGFTILGMKGRSDFTPSDHPTNAEIEVLGSTDTGITLQNNTVKGANTGCFKGGSLNFVLQNNTGIDCGQANNQLDHGIYIAAAGAIVKNNTITGSSGNGIQIYDGSGSTIANVTVSNNTLTGATLSGILVWDNLTPSSTISANLTYQNGRGIDVKGAPFIGNNTIVNNTLNPIVQMFNTSGTWQNAISSLELAHYGETLVGSTVWVTNYNNNSISRFNLDGSSAGADITGNGLSNPVGLAVVGGTEVWVVNEGSQKISRFNTDGTTSNSQISGNGMTNNLPFKIAVVSTQVWVTNRGNSTISRFNTDGTSAGSVLSGNSLAYPEGIAVVGSTVWVGNENGGSSISLFNTNGTSAGSALTGNGLSHPYGIANFNSQVWVADNGADKILIFNTNGSAVSATTSTGGTNAGDPADIISANSQAWISYASCSLCGNGLTLTNSTGGTVANNTFYGNITEIHKITGSGLTFENNIFDENGQPGSPALENSLPASSTYDYNLYYGVSSPSDPDTHSITATDPLFTNPSAATVATSNFTLQSSSKAISAGTSITGLVYWGAAPDLGSQCFYCSLAINSNPTATVNGATTTVTWGTNAKSNSAVNYGLSSGSYTNTSATSDTGYVLSHSNTLTGLSSCTTYHYQVKSIDAYGNSITSGDSTFTTTGCSVPSGPPQCNSQAPSSAPDLYAANANDSASVTLSFTSVSPVSSYFVEYGTASGNYQYATGAFGNSSSQSINIGSLNPGTKYYFKVRGGNSCATGPWSNELSAQTFISQSINFPVEPAILDQLPQVTPQPQEQNFISPVPETNTNNEVKKVSLLIHVLDTDGKGVKNAKVTLHSTPITTYTDNSGVAKFDSVEAGQHTLAISYQNYQGSQPIFVNGDQNISLTVQVKPVNIIQNPVVEMLIAATCVLVILIIFLLFRLKKKSVAQTK